MNICDNIDFFFKPALSQVQLNDVIALYTQARVVSIEQYPGFAEAAEPGVSVQYLLAYRGAELCGYTCIKIKKRVMASAVFGPVVRESADYIPVCRGLVEKCRSAGVLVVRITPPYMTDEENALIQSSSDFYFEHSDSEINWESLKLNLSHTSDGILKFFSENHRRSIKKAEKLNLQTELINDPDDISVFSDQYVQMYSHKGLPVSAESTQRAFQNLFSFFKQNDNGYFLAVRNGGTMIGGVCICYQGDSAFYYKGFTCPEYRNMPINHLALYKAIVHAGEKCKQYFDFGGYASSPSMTDPIHSINRFKDGFRGERIRHPKTMLIYTMPMVRWIYSVKKQIMSFAT